MICVLTSSQLQIVTRVAALVLIVVVSSSSETESDKSTERSPPKRHCTSTSKAPVKSSIVRQYNKKWEEKWPWLSMMKTDKACFVRSAKKLESNCKLFHLHGQIPTLLGVRNRGFSRPAKQTY